jgi:excisionase family DNA binding protein
MEIVHPTETGASNAEWAPDSVATRPSREQGLPRGTPARDPAAPTRRSGLQTSEELPALLTVVETAALLRTTRKAIYAMLERGQLPTPLHIGRRLLLRQDELLDWLSQKRTPSLKE